MPVALANPPPVGRTAALPTVLVVDDEPDILLAVKDLLEGAVPEARIVTADSAAEGLGVLDREHVDLIVTDWKMPGMDGLEFLRQARSHAPRIPRILMTAFERELARSAGASVDVEALLLKPLEPRSMVATVRRLLPPGP